MTFRKATETDLRAIAEIYSDIHTAEETGAASIGWARGIYPTVQTAERSLQRGDLFVGEVDGVVVGAAIINHLQVDAYQNAPWDHPAPDHEVMVLHTLVISPKKAGKGYGAGFVSFYEEYARNHGCRYLRMDTNEKNTRARSIYKKLGYSEIGTVPCVFNGIQGVRLVLLEKKLENVEHQTYTDYFLTTARIGFSKWNQADNDLAETLWGDPEVTKYICASGVFTKEEIMTRLNTEIRNEETYGVQYWPIFAVKTDELIGCCGLRPRGEKEYEIGFHLRPKYWRQGYAKEAACAAIDYAFTVLGAEKLFAGHNPKNIASRKLLTKLGFIYLGEEFYGPTGLYHPSYELHKER